MDAAWLCVAWVVNTMEVRIGTVVLMGLTTVTM
jgi:hypothetical protein